MISLLRAKRLTKRAKASGLRNYDFTAQRGEPIDRADILAAWRAAASEKINGATALPFHLYLHVPFCAAKCRYCWYPSVPLAAPEQIDTYIACLREEAEAFGNATEGITFDTIYIGGGTPSLPGAARFAEMLNIIASNFKIDKTNLNTCEMRPETVSAEKLNAARDFGINRISIGAQSFRGETLSRVGRTGYAEDDVRRAVAAAHEAGIGFVNLDLMAFLPGETAESFAEGVRTACLSAPETIILYRYDPHEELIPPEFPEGVGWRRTIGIFSEAAESEGYIVAPEDPAHSISAIAHRKGWDIEGAMSGGGYEMRGLAPKSVLGLGPFARSFNFGRVYYKNESMPQTPGEFRYRGIFADMDVERRAQLVGHATLGMPLDRRGFARVFGYDPVEMYPEEFRRMEKSGKAKLGADAVSWNFSDADDAYIYSKLFFSEEVFTRIEEYYGLSVADAVKQMAVTSDALPGAEWRFEICEDTGSGPAFRRGAGLKLLYQTYMNGERASLPAGGGSEIADAVGAVFEMTAAETRAKKPESVLRRVAATVRRHAKDRGGHVKCRIAEVERRESLNGQ